MPGRWADSPVYRTFPATKLLRTMGNIITYFEIQSSDPVRDMAFYHNVFGWEFQKAEGAPIEYYLIRGAGPEGAMLKRPVNVPPKEYGTNAYTCTISVHDFDETAQAILENGGTIALPKFPVPGVCWMGYFLDGDNNVFGVSQMDEQAG